MASRVGGFALLGLVMSVSVALRAAPGQAQTTQTQTQTTPAQPAAPGTVQPPPQPSASQTAAQREQDLRRNPKGREWGTVLLAITGACAPPACSIQVDTTPLLPFPAPPNTRELRLDSGRYLITLVNNGEASYEQLTVATGGRENKIMKLPAAVVAAPPPTSGSVTVVVPLASRVTIGSVSQEVQTEATLSVPLGTHALRVENANGTEETTVALTAERPNTRVVILAARTAPAPSSPGAVSSIRWVAIATARIQLGCPKNEADCQAEEEQKAASDDVRAFQMMATEVTAGQFEQWLRTSGPATSTYDRASWSNQIPVGELAQHPAVNVTWDEAAAFCAQPAVGGRLPTEAEWESAARGGRAIRRYPWDSAAGDPERLRNTGPLAPQQAQSGASTTGARKLGNFADASAGRKFSDWMVLPDYDDAYPYTAPVGSFRAVNGLFDIAGNVYEWTSDTFDDPRGGKIATPGLKVLRGGSWTSTPPQSLRTAHRMFLAATRRQTDVGFRCVK